MKYKVGDRVKVRKDLKIDNAYGGITFLKNMARLCGKTATIEVVFDEGAYWLKEDEYKYNYAEEMFEPVVTNWDRLKEISAGEFVGIGFCNIINIMRKETNCFGRSCAECKEWLEQPYGEFKGEILDEVEKEYLSAVIKPFRDRVKHIMKCSNCKGGQYIFIAVSEGDYIVLPYFKEDTMYKGMELRKCYKLEELGL